MPYGRAFLKRGCALYNQTLANAKEILHKMQKKYFAYKKQSHTSMIKRSLFD